jgi:predicted nucleic acid-binding protein
LHRLSSTSVSLDSSVVLDFERSGSLELLRRLFVGRTLISDFVEYELGAASILLPDAEVIALTSEADWQFFEQMREGRPGLGLGESGAMAVARCRGATLLTNDRLARNCAEESGIPIAGAIGVLEYAIEIEEITGTEGVRILEDMIRAGAWISDDLVEMFRQKIFEND